MDESYQSTCNDFDELLNYGIAISCALAGKQAPDDRNFYGDRIYSKLICHAITLRRIGPTGLRPQSAGQTELWDISSACVVARALLETFDALAYITIEPIPSSEREFRILLWKLHAKERRYQMLKLIRSKSPDMPQLQEDVKKLRGMVTSHEFFQNIHMPDQRKICKGRAPAFHLTQEDRNERINVDHEYYKAVQMFLSSYVHTHAFSVHQLFDFRAGELKSLDLFRVNLEYALGFLAKAIEGMNAAFIGKLPHPTERASEVLYIWAEIVKNGVARFED